ncbi:hypothetical protein KIN20_026709 [Parelaphostrongylus tenuis]|uniref:Uncharacterized protein n=1 Tax=Parelaphostrongylus tenuis TaxID=148309 RepID=A0AAD5QYC3_PARTN|nr:hypothetical protein KIN20_026709 [Parelaphostrongylus tenuis]
MINTMVWYGNLKRENTLIGTLHVEKLCTEDIRSLYVAGANVSRLNVKAED